jgi:hypothetical protein
MHRFDNYIQCSNAITIVVVEDGDPMRSLQRMAMTLNSKVTDCAPRDRA